MYSKSSWKFDQKVTDTFTEHVRKSLPFYERLQQMVVSMSDYFITENLTVYDLGCATGETINRIFERHPTKNLQYLGIDASLPMIQKAISTKKHVSMEFYHADLEDYPFTQKSSFVLSLMTLHFLPIVKRQHVLAKIFDSLQPGGSLVLVEKTNSNSPVTQNLWSHLHYEDKLKEGFTPREILQKEDSLRGVLIPLSVEENIALLKSVGFEVDIFFKEWHFTGFLAIKPPKFY